MKKCLNLSDIHIRQLIDKYDELTISKAQEQWESESKEGFPTDKFIDSFNKLQNKSKIPNNTYSPDIQLDLNRTLSYFVLDLMNKQGELKISDIKNQNRNLREYIANELQGLIDNDGVELDKVELVQTLVEDLNTNNNNLWNNFIKYLDYNFGLKLTKGYEEFISQSEIGEIAEDWDNHKLFIEPKDTLSSKIKIKFANIIDPTITSTIGTNGIIDINDVYNKLIKYHQNDDTIEQAISTLNNLSKDLSPIYGDIADLLNESIQRDDDLKNDFANAYLQATKYNIQKEKILSIVNEGKNLLVDGEFVNNRDSFPELALWDKLRDEITYKIENKLFNTDSSFFTKTFEKGTESQYIYDSLQILGIPISKSYIDNIYDKHKGSMLNGNSDTTYNKVLQYIDFISNTIKSDLKSNKTKGFNSKGDLLNLINTIKSGLLLLPDYSYSNVLGKVQQSAQQICYVTNMFKQFRTSDTEGIIKRFGDFTKVPALMYSNWVWKQYKGDTNGIFKPIFNPNGSPKLFGFNSEGVETKENISYFNYKIDENAISNDGIVGIDLEYLNSFDISRYGGQKNMKHNEGKDYTDLIGYSWDLNTIANYINSGNRYNMMLPASDAGGTYGLMTPKHLVGITLEKNNINNKYNITLSDTTLKKIRNTILQELEEMFVARDMIFDHEQFRNAKFIVGANIDINKLHSIKYGFYDKGKDKFSVVENNKPTGKVFNPNNLTYIEDGKLITLKDYLLNNYAIELSTLNKNDISKIQPFIDKFINDALDNKINNFLKYSEPLQSTLFLLRDKNGKELLKGENKKEQLNTKLSEFYIDNYLNYVEFGNLIYGNASEYNGVLDWNKRVNQAIRPGLQHFSNEFTKQITCNDIKLNSKIPNLMKGILSNDILQQYDKEINVADGFSVITLNEYKRRLVAAGRYEEYKHIITLLESGKPLNIKEQNRFIESQKYFSYSRQLLKNIPSLASYQFKNSSMVLVPEYIKGTEWEQVNNLLNQIGADQLNFDSSTKLGGVHTFNIHDKDGNFKMPTNLNEIKSMITEHPLSQLYIQQDIPSHIIDTENKAGVQLMKLIITNLDHTENKTYTINNKKYSGKELQTLWYELISSNIDESANNLLRNLDAIDEDGNIKINSKKDIIVNRSKILDLIREYEDTNTDNINILSSLEGDINDSNIPFFASVNTTKFIQIILSKFTKDIIDQNLPGMSLVLVPDVFIKPTSKIEDYFNNTNYSFTNEFKQRCIQNNNFELLPIKDYDENGNAINGYEAIINPFLSNLVSKDGKIDINQLSNDALEMIGMRIPTEGKQSVVFIKVVGFINNGSSQIILPYDLVNTTGWDFDIDKLFVYHKHLENNNGIFNSINNSNLSNEDKYINFIKSKIKNISYKDIISKISDLNNIVDYVNKNGEVVSITDSQSKISNKLEDIINKFINNNDILFKDSEIQNFGKINNPYDLIFALKKLVDIKSQTGENNLAIKAMVQDLSQNLIELTNLFFPEVSQNVTPLNISNNISKLHNVESFEVFNKRKDIDKLDRKTRDNTIIEIMKSIMRNKYHANEIFKQNEMEHIQSVSKYVNNIAGFNVSNFNQNDYTENSKLRSLNVQTRNLKGISVATDGLVNILSNINAHFDSKLFPTIKIHESHLNLSQQELREIFGKSLIQEGDYYYINDSFIGNNASNTWKDISGLPNSYQSSEVTTNILDAVKKLMFFNFNEHTIGIFKTMSLGSLIHKDKITDKNNEYNRFLYPIMFLSQPIISDYIKIINLAITYKSNDKNIDNKILGEYYRKFYDTIWDKQIKARLPLTFEKNKITSWSEYQDINGKDLINSIINKTMNQKVKSGLLSSISSGKEINLFIKNNHEELYNILKESLNINNKYQTLEDLNNNFKDYYKNNESFVTSNEISNQIEIYKTFKKYRILSNSITNAVVTLNVDKSSIGPTAIKGKKLFNSIRNSIFTPKELRKELYDIKKELEDKNIYILNNNLINKYIGLYVSKTDITSQYNVINDINKFLSDYNIQINDPSTIIKVDKDSLYKSVYPKLFGLDKQSSYPILQEYLLNGHNTALKVLSGISLFETEIVKEVKNIEFETLGRDIDFVDKEVNHSVLRSYANQLSYFKNSELDIPRLFGINKKNEIPILINNIQFQEEQEYGYKPRTYKNASADATIALAIDFTSAGEKLTKSMVEVQNKKYIPIQINNLQITNELIDNIINKLNSINAKTLNIAGNGIYTMKNKYNQNEIDIFTYNLLSRIINSTNLKNKIELIRTGGQTGFDEAGAKAASKLGLKTLILAPKNWEFRNSEGQDIYDEIKFKNRFTNNKIVSNIKNININDIDNIDSNLEQFNQLSLCDKIRVLTNNKNILDYIRDSKFKNSHILENIAIKNTKDQITKYGYELIEYTNGDSNQNMQIFSMLDMYYNSNPYLQSTAEDIVKYSFFKDGFKYGNNLAKIIPSQLYYYTKEELDFIYNISQKLSNNEQVSNEDLKQFNILTQDSLKDYADLMRSKLTENNSDIREDFKQELIFNQIRAFHQQNATNKTINPRINSNEEQGKANFQLYNINEGLVINGENNSKVYSIIVESMDTINNSFYANHDYVSYDDNGNIRLFTRKLTTIQRAKEKRDVYIYYPINKTLKGEYLNTNIESFKELPEEDYLQFIDNLNISHKLGSIFNGTFSNDITLNEKIRNLYNIDSNYIKSILPELDFSKDEEDNDRNINDIIGDKRPALDIYLQYYDDYKRDYSADKITIYDSLKDGQFTSTYKHFIFEYAKSQEKDIYIKDTKSNTLYHYQNETLSEFDNSSPISNNIEDILYYLVNKYNEEGTLGRTKEGLISRSRANKVLYVLENSIIPLLHGRTIMEFIKSNDATRIIDDNNKWIFDIISNLTNTEFFNDINKLTDKTSEITIKYSKDLTTISKKDSTVNTIKALNNISDFVINIGNTNSIEYNSSDNKNLIHIDYNKSLNENLNKLIDQIKNTKLDNITIGIIGEVNNKSQEFYNEYVHTLLNKISNYTDKDIQLITLDKQGIYQSVINSGNDVLILDNENAFENKHDNNIKYSKSLDESTLETEEKEELEIDKQLYNTRKTIDNIKQGLLNVTRIKQLLWKAGGDIYEQYNYISNQITKQHGIIDDLAQRDNIRSTQIGIKYLVTSTLEAKKYILKSNKEISIIDFNIIYDSGNAYKRMDISTRLSTIGTLYKSLQYIDNLVEYEIPINSTNETKIELNSINQDIIALRSLKDDISKEYDKSRALVDKFIHQRVYTHSTNPNFKTAPNELKSKLQDYIHKYEHINIEITDNDIADNIVQMYKGEDITWTMKMFDSPAQTGITVSDVSLLEYYDQFKELLLKRAKYSDELHNIFTKKYGKDVTKSSDFNLRQNDFNKFLDGNEYISDTKWSDFKKSYYNNQYKVIDLQLEHDLTNDNNKKNLIEQQIMNLQYNWLSDNIEGFTVTKDSNENIKGITLDDSIKLTDIEENELNSKENTYGGDNRFKRYLRINHIHKLNTKYTKTHEAEYIKLKPKLDKYKNYNFDKLSSSDKEFLESLQKLTNTISSENATELEFSNNFFPKILPPNVKNVLIRDVLGFKEKTKLEDVTLPGVNNEVLYKIEAPNIEDFEYYHTLDIPSKMAKEKAEDYEKRALISINNWYKNKANIEQKEFIQKEIGDEFKSLRDVYKYNRFVREYNSQETTKNMVKDPYIVIKSYIDSLTNHKLISDFYSYSMMLQTALSENLELTNPKGIKDYLKSKISGNSENRTINFNESNLKQVLETNIKNVIGVSNINTIQDQIYNSIYRGTGLTYMALGVMNAIKNVGTGYNMVLTEAMANQFFSLKDCLAASKEYTTSIWPILSSLGSEYSDDLTTALMKGAPTVFEDRSEKESLKSYPNLAGKIKWAYDGAYFMNNAGDHFMQYNTYLACLKSHKIYEGRIFSKHDFIDGNTRKGIESLLTEDEKIQLNNYIKRRKKAQKHEIEEHSYISEWIQLHEKELKNRFKLIVKEITRLNKESEKIYNELPSVHSQYELQNGRAVLKKDSLINQDEITRFERKVQVINFYLQGIYNTFDKEKIRDTIWGTGLTQFRHWMRPMFERYWETKGNILNPRPVYNEGLGIYQKGAYSTLFQLLYIPIKNRKYINDEGEYVKKGFTNLMLDYLRYLKHLRFHYKMMDENSQAKVRIALTNFTQILALTLSTFAILKLSGDDDEKQREAIKDSRALALLLYFNYSINSELNQMLPTQLFSTLQKTKQNIAATESTIGDLITFTKDVLLYLPSSEKDRIYHRGIYKDETKLKIDFEKVFPVIRQINKFEYIQNYMDWYKQYALKWY
jgi:hypothetical protein